MKKPIFISLDGSDCSGKTTMMQVIKSYFERYDYTVITTREPGGTPLATVIREILVNEDKTVEKIDRVAQLLFFYVSRIQHVKNLIIPSLKPNTVVISDRYMDSTLVYQGLLNGLTNQINELNRIHGLDFLSERPDYTFFFDVSADVAISRATGRGNLNSLDKEYLAKKELPISLFRKHFDAQTKIYSKDMIKTINADNSLNIVRTDTLAACSEIITNISNSDMSGTGPKTYLERFNSKSYS